MKPQYTVIKTGFDCWEVRDFRGFTISEHPTRTDANKTCIALLKGRIKECDLL